MNFNETQINKLSDRTRQLENENTELKKLAYLDYETGLFNKYYMFNIAPKELKKSNFYNNLMVLIDILSLNHIEAYYGTELKTDLVKKMASVLKSELCENSIIGRVDNENMLLLLPNWNLEKLMSYLECCISSLGDVRYLSQIVTGHVNVITYTCWNPFEDSIHKGYNECKLAISYAKSINNYLPVKFEEKMRTEFERKSVIVSSIDKSIKEDNFEIWFQGKYDSSKKRIIGYEALSRWKYSEQEYISPAEFIPLINQSNRFIRFSKYILNKSILAFEELAASENERITLSLNISPNFFVSREFIPYLEELIIESYLESSQIILEITEDVFIGDYSQIIKQIDLLHTQGFSISLDDFGSGYSSLSHVSYININEIKIDRSIVSQIRTEEKSCLIIKVIVLLAKNLGLNVVAEGVEEVEEVELLKTFGITIFQGYFYSKPKPVNQLIYE